MLYSITVGLLLISLASTTTLTSFFPTQTPATMNNQPQGNLPARKGLVNDYTQTLSSTQMAQLEQLAKNYNQQSHLDVSFILVEATPGYDKLEDFNTDLVRQWYGAPENKRLQVLITVRKVPGAFAFNVGRDLSDAQTDAVMQPLQQVTPQAVEALKVGNYYEGFHTWAGALKP